MILRSTRQAPTVQTDLYADGALEDSRDAFARIGDAGPAVWLPRHRMYAMGPFSDVRAALRDDAVFRSTCVGIHLAKLEMQALLRAMIDRVKAIEVGSPERLRNNTLRPASSPFDDRTIKG